MRQVRVPRDTSKNHPIENMMVASVPQGAGIVAQEKQGQRELVASDTLPTEGLEAIRDMLERNGGKILTVVAGDPLFTVVELPKGWVKKGTDHDMHSELLDDKDRTRAGIFYKAAFYDRRASISPYYAITLRQDFGNRKEAAFVVKQYGKVIHTFDSVPFTRENELDVVKSARKTAEEWLLQHYPNARDINAYWD